MTLQRFAYFNISAFALFSGNHHKLAKQRRLFADYAFTPMPKPELDARKTKNDFKQKSTSESSLPLNSAHLRYVCTSCANLVSFVASLLSQDGNVSDSIASV